MTLLELVNELRPGESLLVSRDELHLLQLRVSSSELVRAVDASRLVSLYCANLANLDLLGKTVDDLLATMREVWL